MDIERLQSRNSTMDIIRIVAVFSVISVHFLLNNGFYNQTVQGIEMYIMVCMRALFSVCVPLFMILTGYLMNKKTLCKKYYLGISKTLIVFVLSTVVCMFFNMIYNHVEYTFSDFIFGILDFSGAPYSWYIEMYIGLFLLVPFLNVAYNNLDCQKHKQILVGTLFFITILPTALNIFNFDIVGWWADPKISDSFSKIIPSWWINFYPITYYFTGSYIREYGIRLKTKSLLVLFVIALFIFSTFNFYRSYGSVFKTGMYIDWYGFIPYILSTFLFILLSRIKTDNLQVKVKKALWKISDLVLGIYLLSYIFDVIVYQKLNAVVNVMTERLPYYFIVVPVVFLYSTLASAVINFLANLFEKGFRNIVEFIKKQKECNNKHKWQDILFIILMAGGVVLAFWKSFYGFGGNDEPFYLTVPHRLCLGDSLISDEWNLSQLSSFLTLPFTWIYTTITGSTEGIILAARGAYIIVHAVVSIIIYIHLKKYGYISVFACVLYFIFTPYNIMAMSYNTIGLELITLLGVLMGTTNYKKKNILIISGAAFAGAVLCSPYLAMVYILYAVCVLVYKILNNKQRKITLKTDIFSVKTFLLFSIGVFALAAVFILFLLSRISIKEIFTYIPNLLNDPEHPQIAYSIKVKMYFKSIYECHKFFKISIISYIIVLTAMIIDRNKKQHRSVYLIATTAIVIFSYMLFLPQMTELYYNAIMFPMFFIGTTSYILCNNKPKTLFVSLYLLGILYSFTISLGSNQYAYAIFMAITSSNIASYIFLSQLIREMKENPDNIEYANVVRIASFAFVVFMLVLQGCFQINIKVKHCFWEEGTPKTLTTQIKQGPAKGIYTSAVKASEYDTLYNDIKSYKSKTKGNILFLTEKTWTYLLLDDFPYATFSAWISGEKSSSIVRLNNYYSLNPDKKPTYIYIPKQSKWDLTNVDSEAAINGYNLEETDVGYKLEKKN